MCGGHERFCDPRIYQFWMANNWLVIKAKGRKSLLPFDGTQFVNNMLPSANSHVNETR